jgi:putative transposase
MLRGNEKKNIFQDDLDRFRFLEIVFSKKENQSFYLHSFCLMNNHIHLMVSEGNEGISAIMKRINVSYVSYFNHKYKRVGHLFQDRFKSEIIENDNYVLSLARYIHRNPLKAGIVKNLDGYKWSSYDSYLNEQNEWFPCIDKEIILSLFSSNRHIALKEYVRFMNLESDDLFIELDEEYNDVYYKKIYNNIILEQRSLKNESIEAIIKKFKVKTNLSLRKISDVTGMSKDRVSKLLKP